MDKKILSFSILFLLCGLPFGSHGNNVTRYPASLNSSGTQLPSVKALAVTAQSRPSKNNSQENVTVTAQDRHTQTQVHQDDISSSNWTARVRKPGVSENMTTGEARRSTEEASKHTTPPEKEHHTTKHTETHAVTATDRGIFSQAMPSAWTKASITAGTTTNVTKLTDVFHTTPEQSSPVTTSTSSKTFTPGHHTHSTTKTVKYTPDKTTSSSQKKTNPPPHPPPPPSSPPEQKNRHGTAAATLITIILTLMFVGIAVILVKKRQWQRRHMENPDWAGPSPFLEGSGQPDQGEEGHHNKRISISGFLSNQLSRRTSLLKEMDEELNMVDITMGRTFGREDDADVPPANNSAAKNPEPTKAAPPPEVQNSMVSTTEQPSETTTTPSCLQGDCPYNY
uniref:Uncharacterized protein n=1 Tax=Denticeps clupeoides TaxID=299321 RepID=A0AAY4C7K4_9TELE